MKEFTKDTRKCFQLAYPQRFTERLCFIQHERCSLNDKKHTIQKPSTLVTRGRGNVLLPLIVAFCSGQVAISYPV